METNNSNNDYQSLIEEIERADDSDGELFARLVAKGLRILEVSDSDLAKAFDMSRPTVQRWKEGEASPIPALRKHVYAYLKNLAKSKLVQL
jgi:DNA-binding transcriptional regulator YiaG